MAAAACFRAVYGEGEGFECQSDRFNEEITGYDKNGNILLVLKDAERDQRMNMG